MGGNAVLGYFMHFACADLHFNRPMTPNHSGMQRLVTVGFGQADVVLEASGDRPEGVVHNGEGAVTGLHRWSHDPHRSHIKYFVEFLFLALHLAPDAIEVFGASHHLTLMHA